MLSTLISTKLTKSTRKTENFSLNIFHENCFHFSTWKYENSNSYHVSHLKLFPGLNCSCWPLSVFLSAGRYLLPSPSPIFQPFYSYPVVIIPTLPQHRPPMHVGPPPKSPPLTNGCNYLPPFPHWPLHNALSPKRSLQLSYSLPDIRFGHTPPSRLRSWSSSPTTTSLLKTSL